MEPRYPLASLTWGDNELAAIQRVLDSGQLTLGNEVRHFEREFREFVGTRFAVMVNSGSSANLLAVAALTLRGEGRLERGGEVLVPAIGWSTTYFPFTQYGLTLRFVDVAPDTLNLDEERVEEAITSATRAVMVVNLLGHPCDLDSLSELSEKHGLILIEDCCEALGTYHGTKHVGTFGVAGTFSTYFSHHISTVEGGFVVTDDEEIYNILLAIRSHGWTRQLPGDNQLSQASGDSFQDAYRFVLPGYNVRPLELMAAVGREQLGRFPEFLAARRLNAEHFHARIAELPLVDIQKPAPGASYFAFPIILRDEAPPRHRVVSALTTAGIETRPVVAGNFTRQPVTKLLSHSVAGPLLVADRVHERGFMIGNGSWDMRARIDEALDVLASVLTERA